MVTPSDIYHITVRVTQKPGTDQTPIVHCSRKTENSTFISSFSKEHNARRTVIPRNKNAKLQQERHSRYLYSFIVLMIKVFTTHTFISSKHSQLLNHYSIIKKYFDLMLQNVSIIAENMAHICRKKVVSLLYDQFTRYHQGCCPQSGHYASFVIQLFRMKTKRHLCAFFMPGISTVKKKKKKMSKDATTCFSKASRSW